MISFLKRKRRERKRTEEKKEEQERRARRAASLNRMVRLARKIFVGIAGIFECQAEEIGGKRP